MPTVKGLLIQPDGDFEYRDITSYLDMRDAVGGDFDWSVTPDPVFGGSAAATSTWVNRKMQPPTSTPVVTATRRG